MSALVTAAQEGDRSAFDEIVRRTYVDTYTLAVRLTASEEDARDVVQESYLRAWKGIRRFRGDAQFSTWMYRITANTAATATSKRRRQRTVQLDDVAEPVETEVALHPELATENAELMARAGRGARRASAPAAHAGRAQGRLRPVARGDRRRAGDLGHCGESSPAPGPKEDAGLAVRGGRTACRRSVTRSQRCCPTPSTRRIRSRCRFGATSSRAFAVRPNWPGTAACCAASSSSAPSTSSPLRGCSPQTLATHHGGQRAARRELGSHQAADRLRRRGGGRGGGGRHHHRRGARGAAPGGAPFRA